MKKLSKFFRALSALFPMLGIALIVIGFLNVTNGNATSTPLMITGFVFIAVGAICGAISKVLNIRVGGLVGSVATLVEKIKDSIDDQDAIDMAGTGIKGETEENTKPKKQVTCAYCGMIYNKDLGKCPGCGAKNK